MLVFFPSSLAGFFFFFFFGYQLIKVNHGSLSQHEVNDLHTIKSLAKHFCRVRERERDRYISGLNALFRHKFGDPNEIAISVEKVGLVFRNRSYAGTSAVRTQHFPESAVSGALREIST